MSHYQFRTEPFAHQRTIFDQTRDLESYALLWEQGCGKTKPTIDTVGHLYVSGEIDALLVVAPNGVHRNWITDELPAHMPEQILKASRIVYWDSGRSGTKKHQFAMSDLLAHNGLAILAMSYDGFMTEKGKKFAKKFLVKRRCMMAVDEAHYIKTPTAKRTRTILGASKYAPYRRALTGTPVTQGPFDIYSQIKFVDADFWKRKGLKTFTEFKAYFGVFEKRQTQMGAKVVQYEQLLYYKNLEKLTEWLPEISSRLTKWEALDLPPKVYSKKYVEMTKEQHKAYDEMKDQLFTELANGSIVEAPLVITQMLRFQQIVCGYVTDIDGNIVDVTKRNPRLEALREICEMTTGQGIIWARFTKDIDLITEMLGDDCVRYDGSVSNDDRAIAKEAFQSGDKKWFVGSQQAGATGLTLLGGKTVVYYSNSFKLVDRLQSEDRSHRIGQEDTVNYIDLVTPKTIDENIVKALRAKKDVARLVTGDTAKDWI